MVECTGYGSRYCIEQGEHSWFNHAQDSFRHGNQKDNLPVGFDDK